MPFPRRLFIAASCAALYYPWRAAGAQRQGQAPPVSALKIGALFPLSGADSLIGDEALRGVQLAADASNAAGGIAGQQLTLIAADTQGQSHAEQAAKSLISGSAADLLLGTGTSSLAYPGSDAAELAQIPYIELNAAADGITGRNFKFLIRICVTTSMLAATAIAGIARRYPGKKIGLLFNTGATAGAIAAAALSQWQDQKIAPLLSIGYAEDAADLHDPAARLKRAGAEIILHAAGIDDVLVFFQAMQDIGWKPDAVFGCGEGYGFRETAFALGAPLNGTYLTAAPFYPPSAAGIAAAYLARFGMPPRSADSLSAYCGAKLVFDRLATLNGNPAGLLDSLHQTELPAGALPNGWGVAFDKNGQNTRAFASLQQWQNGSLVTIN
jgi:branched-chain amino acid transport system substrate-binding protein